MFQVISPPLSFLTFFLPDQFSGLVSKWSVMTCLVSSQHMQNLQAMNYVNYRPLDTAQF